MAIGGVVWEEGVGFVGEGRGLRTGAWRFWAGLV